MFADIRSHLSKSPYDLPELKEHNKAEALIKKAILGTNYIVPIETLAKIYNSASTIPEAAAIFLQLINAFDQLGSHPIQVFKALTIMSCCITHSQHLFLPVGRYFIPEIQSILYLSFQNKNAPFRDSVHSLALAIYDNLMFKSKIPDANELIESRPKRNYSSTPSNQTKRLSKTFISVPQKPTSESTPPQSGNKYSADFDLFNKMGNASPSKDSHLVTPHHQNQFEVGSFTFEGETEPTLPAQSSEELMIDLTQEKPKIIRGEPEKPKIEVDPLLGMIDPLQNPALQHKLDNADKSQDSIEITQKSNEKPQESNEKPQESNEKPKENEIDPAKEAASHAAAIQLSLQLNLVKTPIYDDSIESL